MAQRDIRRRRQEDAQRGPAHDDPERQAREHLPGDGEANPPEPARIPEPWPPPDEADRPEPARPEPDESPDRDDD